MKKKLCFFLVILILFAILPQPIVYSSPVENIYLDIRLTKPLLDKKLINLESQEGFVILDNNNEELLYIYDQKIKAVLNNENLSLMDQSGNLLFTLPNDGSVMISSYNKDNSIIKIEKDSYRDYFKLISRNNEIMVLNHVNIENYLYGVVPREMGYNFHIEALKAQAVASRSFALSSTKHLSEGYHLCDTTDCQVYLGFDGEHPNTNLAVDETRGVLALYNGKAIQAIYHSTSSGITEDSINAWGGDLPYLKSVVDIYSNDSPYSSWNVNISLSDFNGKLTSAGIYLGDLKNIQILETTATGNVTKVKLIGSYGEEIITGSKFRSIIGSTTLKSTWFTINNGDGDNISNVVYVVDSSSNTPKVIDLNNSYILDGKTQQKPTRSNIRRVIGKVGEINFGDPQPVSTSNIIIEGNGYGHGVGMSQNGARKMAELGFTFEEILKFYYTDIDVY